MAGGAAGRALLVGRGQFLVQLAELVAAVAGLSWATLTTAQRVYAKERACFNVMRAKIRLRPRAVHTEAPIFVVP